jgi:hypothetical protein
MMILKTTTMMSTTTEYAACADGGELIVCDGGDILAGCGLSPRMHQARCHQEVGFVRGAAGTA